MKKLFYVVIIMLSLAGISSAQRPVDGGIRIVPVVTLSAPTTSVQPGTDFMVPVAVSDTTRLGIIAYQFELHYDPAVIKPQANAVEVAGTISSQLSAVYNPNTPGNLRVAVYGAYPLSGAGNLINLKFTTVGAAGSVSPLTWVNFMFNEGNPRSNPVNGEILVVPGSTPVNFSGRQNNQGTFDLLNSIFRDNTFAMVSDDHENATSMTLSIDLTPGDEAGFHKIVTSDWTVMVYENGAYVGSMYGEIAEGSAVDEVDSATGAVLKRFITAALRIKGGMGRYENVLPQEKGEFASETTYGNGNRTTAVLKRLL
jgi:hypothetical protein